MLLGMLLSNCETLIESQRERMCGSADVRFNRGSDVSGA
jgi:hypothetical protein